MILMADKLQGLLEKRLSDADLLKYFDREHSQFLDLDGGEIFVEIVLNDGSAIEKVQKVVDLAAEEMKPQGISLDRVVRALWEITSVDYSGPSLTIDLKQRRAAEEFRAILKSGSKQCKVIVDVTWAAIELLRHELAPEASTDVREMITPLARRLLEQNLSHGGTSYWDPITDSRLELTATDMSFLLGQSTTFEELRQAISDAFDPPVLNSFLESLSTSHIRLDDFDAVLPQFSGMLGGAYKRGESFSTSTLDLYRRLDRTEQELLRKYFQGKVEQLKSDGRFSDLLKKYSSILGPA